ncbi:MAG: hypothetical protein IKS58_03490 [Paludibacteraceae bacterium]|nr:hypothetical protein [Paludibacteraceae bacterium]
MKESIEKYKDIIDLPHHTSVVHKPMSMMNRAAQFAPFAALTGHDDAIRATENEHITNIEENYEQDF